MVLPLLGSFLAQSILPGMVGSASILAQPLVAGAIGSGVGSLLQGDSLEEAIGSGFGSYFGGKLLGSLGAAGQGAAATNVQNNANIVNDAALKTATAKNVLGQNMKTSPAGEGLFGAPTMNVVAEPVNIFKPPAGTGMSDATKMALQQGAANVVANPMIAAGSALGSMAGQAMMAPPPDIEVGERDLRRREAQPVERNVNFPIAGYNPGVDPEYNYGFVNPGANQIQLQYLKDGGLARYKNPSMMGMSAELSDGGIMALAEGGQPRNRFEQMMAYLRSLREKEGEDSNESEGMSIAEMINFGGDYRPVKKAEGGSMDMPNEKDVIVNAVNAVKGNMGEENAQIALAMFVQVYGEEALSDLVDDVRDGEYDDVGGKADGMVEGGGDGMSDSVPATIDGEQDLLVSKDEYVIDAPTVAMIGNGSSDAGAEKLDNMREEVRKAATGSRMQPKQINATGIMSAALA